MNILISTGIYPPKIGGPAQYSKNLADALGEMGHMVTIKTFTLEDYLPTGIRHLVYFLKIIPYVIRAEYIIALDTFSVGLPTVLAAKICGKKIVIRSGGDFLWEAYVERTGTMVLLHDFYGEEKRHFSLKDRIIFNLTRWTLRNTTHLIFSTAWQRDIFVPAYELDQSKISIIENFYGKKEGDLEPVGKTFLASSRNLRWKNTELLKKVFEEIARENPDVLLFSQNIKFSYFMDKMKTSYAVILVSIGDISPNLILDAIRHNRPFICTQEVGIFDRIQDAGIFVDPRNPEEIKKAIIHLLSPQGYAEAREKVRRFTFTHTWKEIAQEFLDIYYSI